MLYRRYAQCPRCHAMWTTHDRIKDMLPDATDCCPDCETTMVPTDAMEDSGNVMLSPGWHRLVRREEELLVHPTDDAFLAQTYIHGHDSDGELWGDVLIRLPLQILSFHDDKMILLAYRFNTFLPRLSDEDLQEVSREYTANVYSVLAEMTRRGLTQTTAKKKKGEPA